MPSAEVDIDAGLVAQLISEQFPDLAHLAIGDVSFGWDNVVVRVGDDLAARLPRRQAAVALAEHEHRWLSELAARLPLSIPAPIHIGQPSDAYPWPWSICRWLPGTIAAHDPPADAGRAARVLGDFLRALHVTAPHDAPRNPVRGGPLEQRADLLDRFLPVLGDGVDQARIRQQWSQALTLPRWSRAPVWVHGDLHPANLLVVRGDLASVIDFGDLTAGDPACDLSVAWMLFPTDADAREQLRETSGHDDDTWLRARGWAINLGVSFLANSADNATIAAIGERTLASALADQ